MALKENYLNCKLIHLLPKLERVIYIRNDFTDNVSGVDMIKHPKPIASWSEEDSTLNIIPQASQPLPTSPDPSWKVYHKSHLYALLIRGLGHLEYKLKHIGQANDGSFLDTPPESYLCSSQLSEKTKLMYKTMEELLLIIADYVDERGVPLVFVIAPSYVQVEEEQWSRLLKHTEESEKLIRSLPNDKLMKFAENNNLLMIDLLPKFQSEANKGGTLYHHFDQHWSSYGNVLAAHCLLEYLKAESLVE